jgi:hypothetical protein
MYPRRSALLQVVPYRAPTTVTIALPAAACVVTADEQHPLAELEVEVRGVARPGPAGALRDDEALAQEEVAHDRLDDLSVLGGEPGPVSAEAGY